MAKLDKVIESLLKDYDEGLTLSEIAEKVEQTEKKVYKALRKLFEKEKIDSVNRRYKLVKS
ncbi:MAG: MarR family transcriptional regulator [Candidatus Bathyarchaeota archaeon]|jgi:predicted transcriptional regulator